MLILSAGTAQAFLSLLFLLALYRLESGQGILMPWLRRDRLGLPPASRISGRMRVRRMKLVLWLLLLASASATLCDLSVTIAAWFR